jgi:hypothetical protein
MRILNNYDDSQFDPGGTQAPWMFYDTLALDGTTEPWLNAPLGSMYWLIGASSVTVYVRNAAANATTSWVTLVPAASSGNVAVTGTLDVTGALTLAALPLTTFGLGAIVAGKCTAVERGDGLLHQTVLTLTLSGANDLDLAGDADCSAGIKIYDFPAGRIHILGATIDASVVVNDAFNASTNDVFHVSVGSVDGTQAANGDLTGTEADLIPKTTLDTVSNTTLTLPWKTALAAAAQFDGTTTALDVFVNAAVANASTTKAVTVAVTGTLTLTWLNLGDY